ncbi:LPS export ABC transporter ATP-binding protein [Pseudaminobacter sp. NGMCC 1.201702]|uniref:LPS export ABC transporter ATP-binding protein n=1 Tax=Pseudaminobacter sp. NGMCC 1.201702 TaxID=3391825 RepID=UPI0039EF11DA
MVTGLIAEGLQMHYAGQSVVHNVSIAVARGEIVGLFGPSGSGKSTIFNIISGVCRPSSGRISLDGKDIGGLPIDARARLGLGYVPQTPQLFRSLTVAQNLSIAVEVNEKGRDRREAFIRALCKAFELEGLSSARVSGLSGGERKRCEIAFALGARPRILLLDEPLTGLDPLMSQEILRILARFAAAGMGILLTDHKIRDVMAAVHRSYVVNRGTVIATGTARDLVESETVQASFLGGDFRL